VSTQQQEHVRHAFDTYCKRVIRNELFNYRAERVRRNEREMPLSECPELPCVEDVYFRYSAIFEVSGFEILISDPYIASALWSLTEEKRAIILLTCCVNLSDRATGDLIRCARRTVTYKRAAALRELRELLDETPT
jgi:DNA-directed RNA polymerase specialized sigma24 family protein